MANKDLFKQAIAEAKSVREAAIANAKEALEESLTPHLRDMLAAKLQEMEDSQNEEAVNEMDDEEVEESAKNDKEETVEEDLSAFQEVAEEDEEAPVEDDSEEAEDEAGEELESEDEPAEDEELGNLTVADFKDMIRDLIAQEMGGGAEDMGAEMGAEVPADDMDAGADLEVPGEGDPLAGGEDEEEIDLDELIRELEGTKEEEDTMEEVTEGPGANEVASTPETKEKNINRVVKEDLNEALETIKTLRKELSEVNLLNSKLLYVNKIFKANNLSESQKVNIIAAFDKAETVKEVKLVFETVSDNVVAKKETTIKENKGMASKATGTTASKPGVITEANAAVLRMQKLAGIIK